MSAWHSGIGVEFIYHSVAEFISAGETVVLLGVDRAVIGMIGLADTVREEAPACVRELRKQDLCVWMLTGIFIIICCLM